MAYCCLSNKLLQIICRRTKHTKKTGMHFSWRCTISIQWRIQDFPEEGAPTLGGGAPGYNFIKISQKLHEIKGNLARGGGGGVRVPCAPPLRSATGISHWSQKHVQKIDFFAVNIVQHWPWPSDSLDILN